MMKWPKGQSSTANKNVIGDEIYSESLSKAVSMIDGVESTEVFAPNNEPREKQDFMIHLNDLPPKQETADRHVLYLQNGYNEGSAQKLQELTRNKYDGYAFISHGLLDMHKKGGGNGIFLPFGVNTKEFYPTAKEDVYNHEVAYVGNDIKGVYRTERFILPAARFDLGLYGNWPVMKLRTRLGIYAFWEKKNRIRRALSKKALGKIPQEKVPVLYSSSMINLNCTLQDCVDWDVITLRTFEVLACKGFLLTDVVPSAERLLEGGVVFTTGGNDLVQKIEKYLHDEKERERIALKGYEYTIKNATIEAKAAELVAYLRGLS